MLLVFVLSSETETRKDLLKKSKKRSKPSQVTLYIKLYFDLFLNFTSDCLLDGLSLS